MYLYSDPVAYLLVSLSVPFRSSSDSCPEFLPHWHVLLERELHVGWLVHSGVRACVAMLVLHAACGLQFLVFGPRYSVFVPLQMLDQH